MIVRLFNSEKKKTVREKVLDYLTENGGWVAEHEFPYLGTNGSGISRTLRKLQECSSIIGRTREIDGVKKRFKEWKVAVYSI